MKPKRFEVMEPTIGALWMSYRKDVLEASGVEPQGVQMQESRRTFYSACGCMLQLLAQMPERMSEDDAARALDAMHTEAFTFMARVMIGEEGY